MLKSTLKFALLLSILISSASCSKEYADYKNKEVVEDTYTGNVESEGKVDPDGDFTGNGDSGTYSFAWENSKKTADVNFDVTTSAGGSVQMIINDAKGKEILNETRPVDGNDTFSGVTAEGKEGTWLVQLIFTDFNGDGSYSLSPGN